MNTSAKSDYENDHKDIPGNPSTSKTSTLKLNRRKNNEPLRVLNEISGIFGGKMGTLSLKMQFQENKPITRLLFCGNLRRNHLIILNHGITHLELKCK